MVGGGGSLELQMRHGTEIRVQMRCGEISAAQPPRRCVLSRSAAQPPRRVWAPQNTLEPIMSSLFYFFRPCGARESHPNLSKTKVVVHVSGCAQLSVNRVFCSLAMSTHGRWFMIIQRAGEGGVASFFYKDLTKLPFESRHAQL